MAKKWNIPDIAVRPKCVNEHQNIPITLFEVLKQEKSGKVSGGIYHKIQVELTYNSNHIEGNRLTHDQTRYIYETNTIGVQNLPSLNSMNVSTIPRYPSKTNLHYPKKGIGK